MSANNVQNIQDNASEIPAGTTESPKKLDAEFLESDTPDKEPKLPKLDGDPWTIVLTPELEADTVRCNAWKEEVQTLLIFAGLFSAVVTAFVIESYKFLKPDPNDTVIGLLFQIANGLNTTSTFPPSVNPSSILTPVSRSSSSIRINVFWFISLILSLTTVLIGTIALQWLREHQSYVGYSEKEKVAILHMRLQAIEAWHIPQVFAALPLLLQGALILFLAGLIDFSIPLGTKLTIPVSLIVGLTLLFFAATTILPTLQGLSFLWGLYPRKWVPTPCPYKSPQSHALRMLVGIALRAIFEIFPLPGQVYSLQEYKFVMINHPLLMPPYLVPSAYEVWNQQTWLTFDCTWLSLRDACHQGMVDSDPDLYRHRDSWKDIFPLLDATQFLVEAARETPNAKHTESFIIALVHCFQELSSSLWTASSYIHISNQKDRRNNYFEALFNLHSASECSLAGFLLHGGHYKFDQFADNLYEFEEYTREGENPHLFCGDQTLHFVSCIQYSHQHKLLPALAKYQLDLWLWIVQSSSHLTLLTSRPANSQSPIIPGVLSQNQMIQLIRQSPSDQRNSTLITIFHTLLKIAASFDNSRDMLKNSLFIHGEMSDVLRKVSSDLRTSFYFSQLTQMNIDKIIEILKFMGEQLNNRLPHSSSSSQENSRGLLFYFSSIFIHELVFFGIDLGAKHGNLREAFKSSLHALHQTWISSPKNKMLEKWLKLKSRGPRLPRVTRDFEDDWWCNLFRGITEEHANPTSPEGEHIDPHPGAVVSPSSNEGITAGDQTKTAIIATPPAVADHSPDARPQDGDVNIHRTPTSQDFQLEGPKRESPTTLVNHANQSIPSTPSDSFTIQNHPAKKPEGANTLDDPAPSHSGPPSDVSGETHPSNDDRILTPDAAPVEVSQTLPPSNATDSLNSAPQLPAIRMSTSARSDDDSERQDIARLAPRGNDEHEQQIGELHVTIDIEQDGIEMVLPGDNDRAQDEARPEDAVVPVKPVVPAT